MLILLPPSETKAPGGTGTPLNLESLSFPTLNAVRGELIDDLSSLDIDDALQVLGISEALRGEAEANRDLWTAPTLPALQRYTGVLYDALDVATLQEADADAWSRLAVGSALFGVARATDAIPHYRLSASTKLPQRDACRGTGSPVLTAVPTLKRRWGRLITSALQATPDGSGDGIIVDLRSGGYQGLGKVPGAVTVRVESVRPDGSRKVVSHFNKHYKGVLARVLATAGTDADAARTAVDIVDLAEAAGLTVEINEPVAGKAPRDTLTLVA